jgi:hypothetical protein
MCATENRSGNKNDSSGFPVVATQRERAENFRRSLEALCRMPFVVGADWFQYPDEPTYGRSDGENYNMGLVDIHDVPYAEITAAARRVDRNELHSRPISQRPDAAAGIPPAPAKPLDHWKPLEAMLDWDRERGYVPTNSPNPQADLYICWDADAITVGVYAMDMVEANMYRHERVPTEDWPLFSLSREKGAPVTIKIKEGEAEELSDGVRCRLVAGIDHEVRKVAGVRLPAVWFGKSRFQAGDRVTLNATYTGFARTFRVNWKGEYTLAR